MYASATDFCFKCCESITSRMTQIMIEMMLLLPLLLPHTKVKPFQQNVPSNILHNLQFDLYNESACASATAIYFKTHKQFQNCNSIAINILYLHPPHSMRLEIVKTFKFKKS